MKNFQKGHPAPLTAPLRLNRIRGVKSMLVNPRNGVQNGVPEPFVVGTLEHQEELDRVVEARMDVLQGVWPDRYFDFCDIDPMPAEFLLDAGIDTANPVAAAEFVMMDSPDELFNAILRWADAEGIPLKYEQPNCMDFLGRMVHPFNYYMQLCSERMELAFESKYFYLRPRPEELICNNLPQYGCPNHPEAVAGHGTFAGCAYKAFMDTHLPEPQQAEEVKHGTLMLAHLRDSWELGACNIGPKTKIPMPKEILRWG